MNIFSSMAGFSIVFRDAHDLDWVIDSLTQFRSHIQKAQTDGTLGSESAWPALYTVCHQAIPDDYVKIHSAEASGAPFQKIVDLGKTVVPLAYPSWYKPKSEPWTDDQIKASIEAAYKETQSVKSADPRKPGKPRKPRKSRKSPKPKSRRSK